MPVAIVVLVFCENLVADFDGVVSISLVLGIKMAWVVWSGDL